MSYDLYLFPHGALSNADFFQFFSERRHYKLTDDGEACYHNPATGVYFTFSYSPAASAAEIAAEIAEDPELAEDTGWRSDRERVSIFFNMNYVRPHVFGVEAVSEVAAVVEAFACNIRDDQLDGMGRAAFTRDGFVRGWNVGNRFGYQVFHSQVVDATSAEQIQSAAQAQGMLVVPSQRIADVWCWNFRLEQLQDTLSAKEVDVFVPRVMWGRAPVTGDPQAITFIVWAPDVPTVFAAEASHVLVGLGQRAGGFLARLGLGRRGGEQRFLLVERERALAMVPVERITVNGRMMTYSPVGGGVFDEAFYAALSRGVPAADPKSLVRIVQPDGVLDADIFETLEE